MGNTKKKVVLFDIDYTLFDTGRFKATNLTDYTLYEETITVLSSLNSVARLGIFSEGRLDFQEKKLLETKIHDFFVAECVHIVPKKEDAFKRILDQYKDVQLFLVDDKLPVLYDAKMYMPELYTIWVKRGIFADAQPPIPDFSPNATVDSLVEILALIREK